MRRPANHDVDVVEHSGKAVLHHRTFPLTSLDQAGLQIDVAGFPGVVDAEAHHILPESLGQIDKLAFLNIDYVVTAVDSRMKSGAEKRHIVIVDLLCHTVVVMAYRERGFVDHIGG
jgi:hypothetical protein